MRFTSFEAFKADALAAGFDEVLERRWPPDTVIEVHSHAFQVHAVVTPLVPVSALNLMCRTPSGMVLRVQPTG